MKNDPRSRCFVCAGTLLPPELAASERAGAHHFGVRFGDNARRWAYGDAVKDGWPVEAVSVNGEYLTNVYECLEGPDGWAAAYYRDEDGHVHRCAGCGNGPGQVLLRGDVSVDFRDGALMDGQPAREMHRRVVDHETSQERETAAL